MLFKSIDDKIADLGYTKDRETDLVVVYSKIEKPSGNDGFVHRVAILHKANGSHILQSYDPDLFDEKMMGNTCVGLNEKELKLFRKKMIKKFKI